MKMTAQEQIAETWFMNKLSYYERNKIREKYSLNKRALKITDEIILEIYNKELGIKQ